MKRFLAGITVVGVLLAGCGTSSTPVHTPDSPGTAPGGDSEFHVFDVDVRGRKVTCIQWVGYRKGGLSCDWVGAKVGS